MAQPAGNTFRRWARWGLLLTTVTMGASLVYNTWSIYKNVDAASSFLERGLGDTFALAVLEQLRHTREPPSQQDLQELLDEHGEAGLQYIAVLGPKASVIAEAGTRAAPIDAVRPSEQPTTIEHVGDRVRVLVRAPPRRRGRRPPWTPPDDRREPPPDDRGLDRRREPPGAGFIVDFEPRAAIELRAVAKRAVWTSSAAAAVLLAAAIAFSRSLQQREEQQERLERERRLAMLGEMSAVLAHEIRNPLASLKGHAQLLMERLAADTKEYRKAERIVTEARRLETLSSTLLDFVRSGAIERKPVDPAELVRQCVADIDHDRIVVDAASAPPTWSLDPLRVQQVLTNLFENALQASAEGQIVETRVAREGDDLAITVRDHGRGIPVEELERIFDAFRTHRTQGTGLGLAVAQRIVELHGGTISAQNHPDGGALFTVRFPP